MPVVSPLSTTINGKLHAHLLSQYYEIDGDTPTKLLMFTKEEEKCVSNLNICGKTGNHKNMQVAAYLFELGYKLALARKDNVSDSPGFEACGLIFDKTTTKF